MTVAIIYHSVSGHTRQVAEQLADACDGMLIEVVCRTPYNVVTRYVVGGKRALSGEKDEIDPAMIDVADFERIVIGTPVWARHPTPAINAAVDALRGCEGKEAAIYATCGAVAGDTIALLQSALEQKGVRVVGGVVFAQHELQSEEKQKELVSLLGDTCAQ
ncbi:MAG TPA: ArsR family transcriptional regulator [Methanoculleus sp.]|nr:ArsR family transcriptional regulator [Methanoculleus sp.]